MLSSRTSAFDQNQMLNDTSSNLNCRHSWLVADSSPASTDIRWRAFAAKLQRNGTPCDHVDGNRRQVTVLCTNAERFQNSIRAQ